MDTRSSILHTYHAAIVRGGPGRAIDPDNNDLKHGIYTLLAASSGLLAYALDTSGANNIFAEGLID